jgi:predicted CopG family antitoxin
MSERKFTAISVDEVVYKRLAAMGKVPDSFNQILIRILNKNDELKKRMQVVQPHCSYCRRSCFEILA